MEDEYANEVIEWMSSFERIKQIDTDQNKKTTKIQLVI